MAIEPNKSTALVSAGERKQPARRKAATSAVVVATNDTLRSILSSDLTVAKLAGTGGEVVREDGVVLVTGRAYFTGECLVLAEVYYDKASRPDGKGPWLGEADKVSWHDEASGYDCIMLRDTRCGFLRGYVGISPEHPLWGWESEAVPADIGIDVHGGLTYSAICQGSPSPERRLAVEARRICHVELRPAVYQDVAHATEHRVENPHAWWFGFSCDHAYDLIPRDALDPARPKSSNLPERIAATPM